MVLREEAAPVIDDDLQHVLYDIITILIQDYEL